MISLYCKLSCLREGYLSAQFGFCRIIHLRPESDAGPTLVVWLKDIDYLPPVKTQGPDNVVNCDDKEGQRFRLNACYQDLTLPV